MLRGQTTTMTFRRGDAVMLIHKVPADVCDTCKEPVVSGETTEVLLAMFERALAAGAKYAVRDYVGHVA
jgi:YgiT-type zinc finger domain-containing protein